MSRFSETLTNFVNKVRLSCPKCKVEINHSLAKYTTYKVGGNASVYCEVDSFNTLSTVLKLINKYSIDYFVLGGGSNLLVSDNGFCGVVIKLGKDFSHIDIDIANNQIVAGASANLSKVANIAKKNCLSGFEFSAGTPGTLGGAVRMNAGTSNDWIGSRVEWVKIVNKFGDEIIYAGSDMEWGYRSTSFANDDVIIEACFNLERVNCPENIEKLMNKIMVKRHNNQPLGSHTCGCSFVNPENSSAGLLIERAGLKNTRIGGAKVSDIHANFIVNQKEATAQDIVDLMKLIQKEVFRQFAVKLRSEVKFVGFDQNPTLF